MIKNKKVLIGLGAVALVYFIYKMANDSKSPKSPSKIKKEDYANFVSPIGSCAKVFCPPSRPYCVNDRIGRRFCSATKPNYQTVN